MKIDEAALESYLLNHTTEESNLLKNINRRTYLEMLYPRMLSGPLMGRFLAMISRMINPESILEVGTFTGYSTICLAEGLTKNGVIHTIEINEELEDQNRKQFDDSGFGSKIIQHIGDALDVIPKIGTQFDMVFLDADKVHYPQYFEVLMMYMKKGSFLIADNVLWGGKVLSENMLTQDKDALAIKKFNDLVQSDSRVENVMLNIRDGVMMIRKVK
jgi:caffeoyl-CoA O-methyltransferase